MYHVEGEHVREWIVNHHATVLPAESSARVASAIDKLPWVGTAPHWSELCAFQVDLTKENWWEEVAQSSLGRSTYLFLMYARNEPGIIAPTWDLLDSLDELTWNAPGMRFVCAVRGSGALSKPDTDAIGAYDGGGMLFIVNVRSGHSHCQH